MTSKKCLDPSEKLNSDKRGLSTSFTNVSLSKVTLRNHRHCLNKKSKRSWLSIVGEEADVQTDSFSFPIETSILYEEPSLNSGNVSRISDNTVAGKYVCKRHTTDAEIEKQVENNNLNVKETEQMFETINSHSCRKPKKHKKKKKHEYSESYFEPKKDTEVSENYFSEKKSKRSRLAMFGEVADCQTDSFLFPNEENRLNIESSLYSSNIAKISNITEPDKNVCQRYKAYVEIETQVQNDDVKEAEQMFETTNHNSCKEIKKRKKKKKHELLENYIELENEANLVSIETKSDNIAKLSTNMKTDKNALKRHSALDKIETKVQNENFNVIKAEQVLKTTNNNFCKKFKKHKKKKIQEYPENYVDHEDASVPSSSTDKSEKNKLLKMKSPNKTEDVISNEKGTEKAVGLCKMDSPVTKLENKEPSKRNLSFSQSYSNLTVEDNFSGIKDTTHSSPKNLDKSKQNNNHKKIKRKHRSYSKEPQINHCTKNNFDGKKYDENEQLTRFQNQESVGLSEISTNAKPNKKNHVSIKMFSNLPTSPKNNSFISGIQDNVDNSRDTNVLNNKIVCKGQNQKDVMAVAKHPITVFNNKKKEIKCKKLTNCSNKGVSVDLDQIRQDLLAAALKSFNKSPKKNKVKKTHKTDKDGNYEKLQRKTNKKETKKVSKIICLDKQDTNSALQLKVATTMPNQTLPQPCTSQYDGSTNDVKSNETPQKVILRKANKKCSTSKTEKRKLKLNKDEKLDIKKIQQKLLAAALKKVNSVLTEPTIEKQLKVNEITTKCVGKIKGNRKDVSKKKKVPSESKTSDTPEPCIVSVTEPTKEKLVKINEITTKCVEEIKENKKVLTKKKFKAKSKLDPLEDFTANLLSAELKKRQEGLKT